MAFLSSLAELFGKPTEIDAATRLGFVRIAELIDPLLVNSPKFERTLAAPVGKALAYCAGLVDAVPGPLDIERPAFVTNPLVHALFATSNDIDQMLGKSQAVRDFLDQVESHRSDHFYALFAARRVEKRQMGLEVHGDVIQTDVPQTVIYFSDHTLTEPALSLDEARQRLRKTTFDSLLKTFRSHLDELRAEREGARSNLSAEKAHLTMLRGKAASESSWVHTRRIEALDQRLSEVVDLLMPDAILRALADFLSMPEAILGLEPCSVRVNRLGVVVGEDDQGADVDVLEFPELISRDRRHYLVTLARIESDEARRSVREVLDRQRRYVVI